MWHAEEKEMQPGFWWEYLKGRKQPGNMDRCEECVKVHYRDSEKGCGLKSVGAG
jgi:hypothetical protein